ncbi:heat shock factor binding protein 1-domain-containing protein [Xylaria arbuscula]|nr:heat shock factor binding protein 1-domain-containing protein [Xylaria arbuscula]
MSALVKKEEGNKADNKTGKSSDELTIQVEELLNSLSSKFTTVSGEIFAKMDEMSRRLDNLEAALRANEEKPPGSPSKT